MNKLSSTFDIRHLTTATTGEPRSLDYRVQFHYNDGGQLKQISPWHDIPLFSPDGYVRLAASHGPWHVDRQRRPQLAVGGMAHAQGCMSS